MRLLLPSRPLVSAEAGEGGRRRRRRVAGSAGAPERRWKSYPPSRPHLSSKSSVFVLDFPPRRIIFLPSRSDEGRVAIVFETRSGMRRAATMKGPDRVEDRDPEAEGDRRRHGGRTVQVHARATARTNGRVGASDNPWDMVQAAKSVRVRNAGEELLPWLGLAQDLRRWARTTARVSRKRHAGCPHLNMRAPRARRIAQSFRTPLRGRGGT